MNIFHFCKKAFNAVVSESPIRLLDDRPRISPSFVLPQRVCVCVCVFLELSFVSAHNQNRKSLICSSVSRGFTFATNTVKAIQENRVQGEFVCGFSFFFSSFFFSSSSDPLKTSVSRFLARCTISSRAATPPAQIISI